MSDRTALLARLEGPLERALLLKERTLRTFPIRVWQNFSYNNGFLLSAGVSYYILFALFALLYIAFAGAGIWLGGSTEAIDALIAIINGYLPGLIGVDGGPGLVTYDDVIQIAQSSTGFLGITGAIAVGIGVWTAIGAVTFLRRAVRDIFGLPFDTRAYWMLKLGDATGAVLFGSALLLGAGLSWAGVWALAQAREILGWTPDGWLVEIGGRGLSVLMIIIVDTLALTLLVRFLTGTRLPWRMILPGALLGGAAVAVLQLGLGLLLSRTPSNPLLATFTVIVGLLLWCRMVAVVILVAASFIAVFAADRDQPLEDQSETDQRAAELEALVVAGQVRLRRAQEAADAAPWYRTLSAARAVRTAEAQLAEALAEAAEEASRKAAAVTRVAALSRLASRGRTPDGTDGTGSDSGDEDASSTETAAAGRSDRPGRRGRPNR